MENHYKFLNNSVLDSMDIAVIHHLREKNLKPKDVGEFFECLKILDEDKRAVENIIGHTSKMLLSIYDIYRYKEEKHLLIIISNISI